MSKIGDFFNRIKNRIMPNKQLQIPEQSSINPVLKKNINQRTLDSFENPNNYNDYCKDFFSKGDNFDSQYNYLEVVSQMQENGAMDDFANYFIEVQNNSNLYYPSKVHGIEHTSRVVFFAEMLCSIDGISAHEKDLIMRAAQLHDIGREDDGKNFDHGLASRYKIEQSGLLSGYSEKDQEIIKFAVESHSLEPEQIEEKLKTLPRGDRKAFKKVLDYLQDADKLDRTRIANKGWGLDPQRLASDTAKKLVKVAHENFYEFNNVIDYEVNKKQYIENYNTKIDAFNLIKSKSFNITFQDFENIVNEYKPGTLEMLMQEGRVEDIFAYKTFMQYSLSESEESIKSEHDTIFKELGKNDQIEYLESTYDTEFMLHYNLKTTNYEAYNLYQYADLDISARSVIGVANQIQLSDLDKLFSKGYYLRLTDLYYLASNLTPEEYRATIDSGNLEDLFSSKYEKHPNNYEFVQNKLKSLGLNYDENIINQNYRFIEKIIEVCPEVLKDKDISNYTFAEIYTSVTKVFDASTRLSNKDYISYTAKDILEFAKFSKNDSLIYNVSEKEQLDIVEKFIKNKEVVKDPRYIQYMLKKNRPYNSENIEEILNYNEFCADSILLDQNISLQEAKVKLINGLFNLDVPPQNRSQFEKELVEELYYHKKYLPQSSLYEKEGDVTAQIAQILSSKNIKDFKNLLFSNKASINLINTHNLGNKIKADLIEVSKNDMAYNLQKTANEIHSMEEQEVYSESGRPVKAKILSGQKFYMATSTAMPKCSSTSNKLIAEKGSEARKIIYEQMLQREIDPNEICTSIVSDKMIAHAASAMQDQELKFGFVPQSKDAISIAAMYDLSTTRKNSNVRTTHKAITPRGINDFVHGTTEEHNEAVISAYPDFIVCYDKITDIAIDKQKAMQLEYDRKGINKKIEIVLVDAKNKYIPQIKSSVDQEHAAIEQKLRTNTLTENDFKLMFERPESNFVLRTLQAMHSTSYRDDVWDTSYNTRIINSMTKILDEVAKRVPEDKARVVLDQVDLLLERSDRNSEYGSRFYDHSYAEDIDSDKLQDIRGTLVKKVFPYEKDGIVQKNNEQKQDLTLEEINIADMNLNRRNSQTTNRRPESPDEDAR